MVIIFRATLLHPRLCKDDMLIVAAKHGVKTVIEKFEFSDECLTEALGKLNARKSKYLGVFLLSR
jgi:hypothetical protein